MQSLQSSDDGNCRNSHGQNAAPLTKWVAAMRLVAEDKRGLSAMALQRKIGVAYLTAWTMLQKIRFAMSSRDEKYMLDGIVEMDESFCGGTAEGGKRGRGTEKAAVLVSVSLRERGKPLFARMKTIESVDGEAVKAFSGEHVKPGSETCVLALPKPYYALIE